MIRGALAGVDLFLVCHHVEAQRQAIEGLVRAVERGEVPRSRVEEACSKLDALAARFFHLPADSVGVLGSAEHLALSTGLAAAESGRDPTEGLC